MTAFALYFGISVSFNLVNVRQNMKGRLTKLAVSLQDWITKFEPWGSCQDKPTMEGLLEER